MAQTIHSIEQCIENCVRCHRICLETAARHFGGEARIEGAHLRLLLDCAEICRRCAETCREMAGATSRHQ